MEKNLNSQRIKWVDFAKGIGIILVVTSHVIPAGTDLLYFIYTFHMPFFFVMSGYLLNTSKWSNNFSKFKYKLQQRLLIPYFVANFAWFPIWFIFWYCLGFFAIEWWAERTPINVLLSIFVGNNNNVGSWLILYQLWFLPCLMFAELTFLKLHDIFSNKISFFYLALIGTATFGYILGISFYFQLPLGIDISFVALIFLLAGNFIKKYNLPNNLNLIECIILIMLFSAALYVNEGISMSSRIYKNIFLFYIGGISGSLLLMKISMLLSNLSNKIFDFIKYCGKQSLIILILHIPSVAVVYNLIAIFDNNIAEIGFRHLPPEINLLIIIFGVIIPVYIAKNFKNKPIIKYFCV